MAGVWFRSSSWSNLCLRQRPRCAARRSLDAQRMLCADSIRKSWIPQGALRRLQRAACSQAQQHGFRTAWRQRKLTACIVQGATGRSFKSSSATVLHSVIGSSCLNALWDSQVAASAMQTQASRPSKSSVARSSIACMSITTGGCTT